MNTGGEKFDLLSFPIREILEQVHPGYTLSDSAMRTSHSLIYWLIESITRNSLMLRNYSKSHQYGPRTIDSRSIQTMVRVALFSSELAKHAVSEGTKAVTKVNFNDSENNALYQTHSDTYLDR